MRMGLIPVVVIMLSGCVSHRASLDAGPGPVDGVAVGAHVHPATVLPWSTQSPRPVDIPATLWRQDEAGVLYRADLALRTPTPWWQRFPSDLVTDVLWPGEQIVAVQPVPEWTPAGGDATGLTERAIAAGYGRASPDPTHPTP